MNAKILVLVGALALGLTLFLFLNSGKGTDERGKPLPEREAPAAAQEEALEAPTPLETPALVVQAEGEGSETREALPAAEQGSARDWPAEETRWVEVRLFAPPRTPLEERAQVLALAKDASFGEIYGQHGPALQLNAGKDPRKIEGLLGATPVDLNGTARIGLPPDAKEAWLAVSGLYLYSLKPFRIDVAETAGPVDLRPALGAWITGRLKAPPGITDTDFAQVEVKLDWSINAALQLGTAGAQDLDLETKSDAEGSFEFRSIPVGKPQTVSTRSSQMARAFAADLDPVGGEHARVELELLIGGTVRGRVVDEGGAAVAGAEVTALGREFFGNPSDDLRETQSDAEGRFELAGLTPGKVWLRVQHDDFQTLLSPSFELADREVRNHGDVQLSEGLFISGTVVYPDGRAAAGTTVSVEPDLSENLAGSPVNPRDYIGARNEDTADEEGAFRITGLGPGPWVVSAKLELADTGAGDAAGRWSANQGIVRATSEGLRLMLEPPVTVNGIVLDGKQQPISAFSIKGERSGSQWYMPPSETREESFESADGRFSLTGLRSGEWKFTAAAKGHARSEKTTLQLPSDEPLEFALLRPVLLGGRVVDPDGRPVAGAEVSKELEGTQVFEAMQGRGDWPMVKSDDEGAFTLEGLPPGTGSILAKKDGFAPSEPVSLELGEGEERLDLVLALRRGGTISGEVYGADGQRSSGCMVILQMPTLAERRFTNTDSDGHFEESGLKPGTWQVQAFPGIGSLQSESGEALDQATLLAALKMTSVELVDEADEHVVLGAPAEDPVRVFGKVTLDAKPISGSMISFVAASGGGLEHLKVDSLGEDGAYEVQLDEPGDYLVTVQVTSTPGRQNSIEFRHSIPKGEEFELDFELPLGGVSGRVKGPDGKPVPRARVTLNMQGGLVFGTVFGGHYNETSTDENGEYEINCLRPGSYSVAVGGSFLGGLFGEGTELGRVVKTIDVRENEWVRGLDFRLEEPGTIRGTVRDSIGKLVAEASIFLRDESGQLVELFSLAQTNASGSFEYPGLAPGSYTVTARSSNLASTEGVPVRVRSGESSEVTVVLQPGTMLLVTLVDNSGADVPSRVSVLDGKGREMNGMLGLKELMERYSGGLNNTAQSIGPLPPGTYKVQASAEDGRSTSRPVDLAGQPERKIKLRLD